MSETHEIVLAVNQSANTGECGSCRFFTRENATSEWDLYGRCRFRLPPNRVFARNEWDGETRPLDSVNDTDRCDLWQSSGKTFIVSQRIKP